jgi:hypothetical protein
MSFDFSVPTDEYISLKEVPNYLPKRNGKKVHYSTVYRWATKGVRGQVLQTELIGGILYTTTGALLKFRVGSAASAEHARVNDAIESLLSNSRN